MAVIERTYKRYTGVTSPEWSRFLIITRHAFRDVFRSKIFTGIFLLSFVWPLVCAILIYLHHNANVLAMWQINVRDLLPIDAAAQPPAATAEPGTFGASAGRAGELRDELRVERIDDRQVRVARWVMRPNRGWELQQAQVMLPPKRFSEALAAAARKGVLGQPEGALASGGPGE